MKKFIALFLIFSLIGIPGSLFAKQRKGADLLILKTDGQQVGGELIAVKQTSLLLKEIESGVDVSVDIGDIKVIKIVKESKAGVGLVYGSLIGGVIGAITAFSMEDDPPLFNGWGPRGWSAESKGIFFFVLISGFGATSGAIIGTAAGRDVTFQIEGKSDSEVKVALEKLRKKARIRNYQ
jgi:hypothetical protein